MRKKPGRPRSRKSTLRGPRLSIRITRKEKAILNEFVHEIKKRRPYVNQSIVYRELLGLTYTDLIFEEDRRALRKRIEAQLPPEERLPPVEEKGYSHDSGDHSPPAQYAVAGSRFKVIAGDDEDA